MSKQSCHRSDYQVLKFPSLMCRYLVRSSSFREMSATRIDSRKWLALALSLSLFAASCGGATDTSDSSNADTSPSGVETSGDPRLVGEFATIDQATFDLASIQGEDTVLWFWAPW